MSKGYHNPKNDDPLFSAAMVDGKVIITEAVCLGIRYHHSGIDIMIPSIPHGTYGRETYADPADYRKGKTSWHPTRLDALRALDNDTRKRLDDQWNAYLKLDREYDAVQVAIGKEASDGR